MRVPVFRSPAGGKPRPTSAPESRGAAIHAGFPAIFDSYTATPPDSQGAVGRSDVVSMVNSEVLVQSRSGAPRAGCPVSLYEFFRPLGEFARLFDPRILYDAAHDRWLASSGANPETADAALLLAVSRTGDPGGEWDLFLLSVGTSGCWADYPVLGISRDWIVLSANLFQLPPVGGYARTAIYVFDKAALYESGKTVYATFSDTEGEFAQFVDLDNASEAFYLAQAAAGPESGTIRVGVIEGPVGQETFTAGAVTMPLPGTWSSTSPKGEDFAPQAGSWLKVDTGDSRLQNCVLRGGRLWCTQTVFLPAAAPTRSSIQWVAVDPATGRLLEHGLIDDTTGGNFYAFPSIAVNTRHDVLIGYTRFTANDYPSAGFAFRANADGAGEFQTGGIVKAGEAPYVGRNADESANRWGDISATVVDPDGLTFWTIQEYAAVPTNYYPGRWGTWWAAITVIARGDSGLAR